MKIMSATDVSGAKWMTLGFIKGFSPEEAVRHALQEFKKRYGMVPYWVIIPYPMFAELVEDLVEENPRAFLIAANALLYGGAYVGWAPQHTDVVLAGPLTVALSMG